MQYIIVYNTSRDVVLRHMRYSYKLNINFHLGWNFILSIVDVKHIGDTYNTTDSSNQGTLRGYNSLRSL